MTEKIYIVFLKNVYPKNLDTGETDKFQKHHAYSVGMFKNNEYKNKLDELVGKGEASYTNSTGHENIPLNLEAKEKWKKSLEIAPDKKTAMKLNKELNKTRKEPEPTPEPPEEKREIPNDMKIKEVTEPVMYNNEIQWLIIKKESKAPEGKQEIKMVIKGELETEKIISFELKKQGMWQCKKCGAVIESNPKEPTECPQNQGGCGRTSNFDKITDTINNDLWKIPTWKNIDDLDMFSVYDDMLKLVKRCVIFPEEIQYKLITLWIISTWKTGHWSSVGFPLFLGDHDSGKTRALDIMRELAYRMIHSAGTTFPAMVRATHFYHAGLIIDEASDRLNRKTDTGREMLNFVKPSYREGSRYTAADKDDPEKIISYKNFGFKSFAGERSFDHALLSRSIIVVMQQADPEIPELYYIQDELDDIQTKLLNYRYKTGPPTDLGMTFILKGRLREVFGTLISTAMHIGQPCEDIIDYALLIKKEQQEDLIGTLENDILVIIKSSEESQTTIDGEMVEDAPEYVYYKDLLERLFPDIDSPEDKKQKGQQLGYAVRRLRLKTKKLHGKNVIPLHVKKNSNRLRYLYRKYGM